MKSLMDSLLVFKTVLRDPEDPQDFGFLDPDPQKYADLRIWIKGGKYHPKTEKNFFTFKPKSELLKKEGL